MERKARWLWWGFLAALVVVAAWKVFLPHGTKAYQDSGPGGREIVVYVAGAVEKPSLLHLPLEARLNDALQKIRPLPDADLECLNPAEKLKDGQKIMVPFKRGPGVVPGPGGTGGAGSGAAGQGGVGPPGQGAGAGGLGSGGQASVRTPAGNTGSGMPAGGAAARSSAPGGAGTAGGAPSPGGAAAGKININTADAAELDKLPGVGPALAARILQYRTEHGPFARPEDLQEVAGIGPKTFAKMASLISVGP
ncbi:ComE operon protein 1 [Peptococcaceae bacterium CEB3]|nr:ComE operon protein 1 [Peptococcaceae bacterium CEB3]